MRKRLLLGVSVLLSSTIVFANPSVFPVATTFQGTQACSVSSDTLPNFCALFKNAVTTCSPIPGLSMQRIYSLMIAVYGNLNNACLKNAGKYGGGVQACIDQWNCYWNGGSDSQGALCSGTGTRCDSL